MRAILHRFLASEHAATSIEYAIIAAGVSITILVAVNALGTSVLGRYEEVSNALDAAYHGN
ncbi:hypothetical protein A33M_3687 [Rhodovulum sp. PH10]|uniref:Flp family type IVb pilin n=1 Tax=Rhodovulum sp. PH10 TaxID=1187851 RepID=UPI00027C1E63|nr:Flp family type IVb pilin [Rhodovulum sp. PH10]EJW10946.1 hypothetical protein A33M_3687 [Rhodovulum sp. PH10]